MPFAPRPPCAHVGCPARAVRYRRCAVHAAEYERLVIAPARARHDATRPTAARRGYDQAWREVRARQLRQRPTCHDCGAPAAEVHHVVALRHGGARLDPANLMSLCTSCHSRRTGRERSQPHRDG